MIIKKLLEKVYEKHPNVKILIGIIFIVYSIFKITMGGLACVINQDMREKLSKLPVFKYFVLEDYTISGKVFDFVLMLFGIYTLLHGLNLLNLLPKKLENILLNTTVLIIINAVFGLFLTGYFYLVLFTNVPISKNMNYADKYIIPGFISGLAYLISLILIFIFRYYQNKTTWNSVLMTLYIITIIILIEIFIYILVTVKKINNVHDLIMIPLNTII